MKLKVTYRFTVKDQGKLYTDALVESDNVWPSKFDCLNNLFRSIGTPWIALCTNANGMVNDTELVAIPMSDVARIEVLSIAPHEGE